MFYEITEMVYVYTKFIEMLFVFHKIYRNGPNMGRRYINGIENRSQHPTIC